MRAGELFEIADGNRRAVVTEQGATLFRAQWEGKELLDTLEEDGYASHGCYGQHLMPWPGRVPKGLYEYEGERYQLPITDHVKDAAIHGWTRWATWHVTEHGQDNITLGCRVLAQPVTAKRDQPPFAVSEMEKRIPAMPLSYMRSQINLSSWRHSK